MSAPNHSSDENASEVGHEPLESTIELLSGVRRGDERAVERFYSRYAKPLRRWARGRLPGWARDLRDTDDLVQEVLVAALKQAPAFEHRGGGALQGYLRQAVTNRVRDEIRRVGRRPNGVPLDLDRASAEPGPLELAVGKQTLAAYDLALASLSDDEREGVIARLEMGASYAEIADLIDLATPDAARMMVSRALLKVAERMRHVR